VTPTAHNDPSGQWSDETNAYDDNDATYAMDITAATSWSAFLELEHSPIYVDAIKAKADMQLGSTDEIDVDVYVVGSGWTDGYQGAYNNGNWDTFVLPTAQTISATRIRINNTFDGGNRDGYIYEVDFRQLNTDTVTADGLSSDDIEVKVTADTSDFKIYIDNVLKDTTAITVGVPDNANQWEFMGNVMPYINNVSIEVDGVELLRYEPAEMIVGNNLPNIATPGSYNGTIHWGSNPAGVDVSIGSMVSSSQPSIGIDGDTPASDITPPVEVSDWYIDPDVTGSLLTNPLRPFVTMMSDNSTLSEILAWRFLALAFVLLVTVVTLSNVGRHQGITAIVASIAFGVTVAMTIFPMWTLIFE